MKKNEKAAIKKQFTKEIVILLSSFAVIIAIAAGVYYFTQKEKVDSAADSSAVTPLNLVRDFNHKKGPENAKVKIVEFYDPECEACAAFAPFIKEIVARFPDDIQLTVRYALYHGNSTLAAKASDAAAIQGKFWEFQDLLFVRQNEWSHQQGPATSYFLKYAQELGMDTAKFETDMNDLKRMETISIDLEDGTRVGVNGTPTIFVNGKKLEQLNPNAFRDLVESEIKK